VMTEIKSICVYCGSSDRGAPSHATAATQLGTQMAKEGIALVYGGGRVGIMGAVSRGVQDGGGKIYGIIPHFLMKKEIGDREATDLEIVETMHERKARMVDLSDGFVILPGGLGTLDEFFEVLTWRQLGLHDKPIVVVNLGGYWNRLLALIEGMIEENYVHTRQAATIHVVDTIEEVLPALRRLPAESHPPITERT
jgi:uncharacterized protein (TIGR00730 family)